MHYYFYVIFFLFGLVFPCEAREEIHVGYRSISTWNSRENVRLDVGVWYPTRSEERDYVMDEYHVCRQKRPYVPYCRR